eukprot:13396556-Alexandrium_andersonii.AAC.1
MGLATRSTGSASRLSWPPGRLWLLSGVPSGWCAGAARTRRPRHGSTGQRLARPAWSRPLPEPLRLMIPGPLRLGLPL